MKKKIKFNRILWIGFVFVAALMILLPNKATLQLRPPRIEDLPPLEHYQREGNPKMESVLYRLMKIYFTQGIEEAKEFAEQRGIDMQGDLVRVVTEAKSPVTKEKADTASYGRNSYLGNIRGQRDNLQASLLHSVSTQIEAFGGKVETTYRRLLQSVVPIYALQDLADLSSVRYLRLPRKPIPLVTSEGVEKTGADQWHNVNSYRQTEEAKVCILDGGFYGYEDLLGTELPSSVTTRSFRADGDLYVYEHGTACAEIVHDMAPNARLWLVNFSTGPELYNAVDWIINQGVEIISYSMGSLWDAGDGTGPDCEIVKEAANSGIIWVSSAGNEAEDHWAGIFSDTDSDGWHNFSGVDEILDFYVPANIPVGIFLKWDDWGTWNGLYYSGSNQDYDLYLYYWDGLSWNYVDRSENWQTGTQEPVEYISGWSSITPSYWGVTIGNINSTRDVKFDLFISSHEGPLEYNVAESSLSTPADSPYAVTVGAVDWSNDTYHTYSSQGPTSDGRIKPDLCAPSGVSTESYGTTDFYGTSASAPHVAGAFALLKGKLPYTLDQINSILEARAKDLGSSGKDNQFGYGRLNLLKGTENGVQLIEEEKDHKVGLTMNKKSEQIIFEDEPKIYDVVSKKHVSFQAHKSMGLLYLQQDLKEKALKELLRAIELEPLDPEPYFEVGKIYQEIGWKRKAIEHYEKFLALWKDADPGILEVGDAKKRLAGLQKL